MTRHDNTNDGENSTTEDQKAEGILARSSFLCAPTGATSMPGLRASVTSWAADLQFF